MEQYMGKKQKEESIIDDFQKPDIPASKVFKKNFFGNPNFK